MAAKTALDITDITARFDDNGYIDTETHTVFEIEPPLSTTDELGITRRVEAINVSVSTIGLIAYPADPETGAVNGSHPVALDESVTDTGKIITVDMAASLVADAPRWTERADALPETVAVNLPRELVIQVLDYMDDAHNLNNPTRWDSDEDRVDAACVHEEDGAGILREIGVHLDAIVSRR